MVLIGLSLMVSDDEHHFVYLYQRGCLEKMYIQPSAHFLIVLFIELYELFIGFGFQPFIIYIIC